MPPMKELADGGSERALGGDPCAAASADQTTAAKNTSNRDTTFTEEPFLFPKDAQRGGAGLAGRRARDGTCDRSDRNHLAYHGLLLGISRITARFTKL